MPSRTLTLTLQICKVLIVAGLISIALCLAQIPYHQWKERRSLDRAQKAIFDSNFSAAWIAARHTLQINSSNTLAWAILADVAEHAHLPHELILRKRLADLEPESPARRIQLANAAIRLGDPASARTALRWLLDTRDDSPAAHEAAANLALLAGDREAVQSQLHLALRQAWSPVPEFNLTVVGLVSNDPKVQSAARAKLQVYRSKPEFKREALRSLIADALARQQLDPAERLSTELLADPEGAELKDCLRHLDILQARGSPQLLASVRQMQARASNNVESICLVGGWMTHNQLAAETLNWASQLPPPASAPEKIRRLAAEGRVAQSAWPELERTLRQEHWNELEFERWAFLALALLGQGEAEAGVANWRRAMRMADGDSAKLRALAERAASWGWVPETEALLWHMAKTCAGDRWAVLMLTKACYLDGATASLRRLCALLADRNPDDLVSKNNLALTSLLLKTNVEQACTLAQEVFAKQPSSTPFASTFAYSLFLRGALSDALQVLRGLPEEHLHRPSTAAYYGSILAASENNAEAQYFLALAERAQLLPEECELVQSALSKIDKSRADHQDTGQK